MKVILNYRIDVELTIDLDDLIEMRDDFLDFNEINHKNEIALFLKSCLSLHTCDIEKKLEITNEYIDNLPNEAYEYLKIKKEQKQLKELIHSNTTTTKSKSI